VTDRACVGQEQNIIDTAELSSGPVYMCHSGPTLQAVLL